MSCSDDRMNRKDSLYLSSITFAPRQPAAYFTSPMLLRRTGSDLLTWQIDRVLQHPMDPLAGYLYRFRL